VLQWGWGEWGSPQILFKFEILKCSNLGRPLDPKVENLPQFCSFPSKICFPPKKIVLPSFSHFVFLKQTWEKRLAFAVEITSFSSTWRGEKKIFFGSSENPNLRICRSIFFGSSILPQANLFLGKNHSKDFMQQKKIFSVRTLLISCISLLYIYIFMEKTSFVFLFLVFTMNLYPSAYDYRTFQCQIMY